DRAPADPAARARPAGVAVLTVNSRLVPALLRGTRLRADLAQLGLGLLVDAGRQRRIAQVRELLLAVSDQVADVRLEQLGGVGLRLLLVDKHPRLSGDRVELAPEAQI